MKKLLIGPLIALVVACSGHTKFSESQSSELLMICKEIQSAEVFGQLSEEMWPESLRHFKARQVSITNYGAYIRLERLFVEESGIFCAFKQRPYEADGDPSYRPLADGLYTYHVLG